MSQSGVGFSVVSESKDLEQSEALAEALVERGFTASPFMEESSDDLEDSRKRVYLVLLSDHGERDPRFLLKVASAIQAAATNWRESIVSVRLARGASPRGMLALFPSISAQFDNPRQTADEVIEQVSGLPWDKPQEIRDKEWEQLKTDRESLRSRERRARPYAYRIGPAITTLVGALTLATLAITQYRTTSDYEVTFEWRAIAAPAMALLASLVVQRVDLVFMSFVSRRRMRYEEDATEQREVHGNGKGRR